MSTNLDERLLGRWIESQHRQKQVRARLANSSLPVERFENWALDLIADALSAPRMENRVRTTATLRPVSALERRPTAT
jgi:hypothetical protein